MPLKSQRFLLQHRLPVLGRAPHGHCALTAPFEMVVHHLSHRRCNELLRPHEGSCTGAVPDPCRVPIPSSREPTKHQSAMKQDVSVLRADPGYPEYAHAQKLVSLQFLLMARRSIVGVGGPGACGMGQRQSVGCHRASPAEELDRHTPQDYICKTSGCSCGFPARRPNTQHALLEPMKIPTRPV